MDRPSPTATVSSVALLLDHLGFQEPAARVRAAVDADLAARSGLPRRSTQEIGDALVEAISRA